MSAIVPTLSLSSCANADALSRRMFANVDLSNQAVRNELFRWAEWLEGQLPIGGLRLDAIKHMSTAFVKAFVKHAKRVWGRDCLLVGEYWVEDSNFLANYVDSMNSDVHLYDIKLVHNFRDLSWAKSPDLRTVFDGTLAQIKPEYAFVSFRTCILISPCP